MPRPAALRSPGPLAAEVGGNSTGVDMLVLNTDPSSVTLVLDVVSGAPSGMSPDHRVRSKY